MNVAPPVPLVTSLLLVVLPAVGWLGWQLARTLSPPRQARLLAPVLGLTAWLVCLHAASYLLQSFSIGLVVGTLVPAALGATGWALRKHVPRVEEKQEEELGRVPTWWLWGGAVTAALLVSPAAFGWAFHDEVNLTGHMSIASQIQNGIYPPRHLTMAGFELRYHYGFNTMTAAWASVLRIPVSWAIDLLTVLSWAVCWLISCDLGSRLLPRGKGWLLAPLMLFGGGLPVICEAAYDAPLAIWVAGCVVDHAYVGPPLVSLLFQHPWGLGFPLGLALLSISLGRRYSSWTAIVSGLLLLGLALSQLVFFASLALAIPASRLLENVWNDRCRKGPRAPFSWHTVLLTTAPAAVSLAIASQLGGMFASSPSGSLVAFGRGPTPTWLGTLEWNFSTFGLFLPLGVLGVLLLARRRVLLPALMLGGSMLVLHTIVHTVSWDIVKFAAIAQIALVMGTAETCARMLQHPSSLINRIAPVVAFLVLVHAGLVFCGSIAFGSSALPRTLLAKAPVTLEPDDFRVVEQLRPEAQPGDVVYRRRKRTAYGYAQWGGLPQLWTDRRLALFDFPAEVIARRQQLLNSWPSRVEAYRAEGVRWLVLDEEDELLRAHAETWLAEGSAKHRLKSGRLDVIEIMTAGVP